MLISYIEWSYYKTTAVAHHALVGLISEDKSPAYPDTSSVSAKGSRSCLFGEYGIYLKDPSAISAHENFGGTRISDLNLQNPFKVLRRVLGLTPEVRIYLLWIPKVMLSRSLRAHNAAMAS